MVASLIGNGSGGVQVTGKINYYIYTPYDAVKAIVNTKVRLVKGNVPRPIERLIVNIGGPFERIGGNDEAIGGDVTKVGQ